MTEIESPKIIQEEIKNLQQKLEAKQKELAESGLEVGPEAAAKEVIKEYTAKSLQPVSGAQTADEAQTKKAAQNLSNEPHAKQIEELLNIADKKGILTAVEVAKHLKNQHLLDDFHDRLVFELLQKKART